MTEGFLGKNSNQTETVAVTHTNSMGGKLELAKSGSSTLDLGGGCQGKSMKIQDLPFINSS